MDLPALPPTELNALMDPDRSSKPFPIPVRVVGPGSQVEEETLEYLVMPSGMSTWRAPILPEPETLVGLDSAKAALVKVHEMLAQTAADGQLRTLRLDGLDAANLALLNQVLGEGEVAVKVETSDWRPQPGAAIQESVYAGVWRVIGSDGEQIDVGAYPRALHPQAEPTHQPDPRLLMQAPEGGWPAQVMNAPAILTELAEQLSQRALANGAPDSEADALPHVINLTLLPLTPEDLNMLDAQLGYSGVTVLSRGYGNCRVTRCAWPSLWHSVYYNSQDQIILNTLEITSVPDVIRAASEDLHDSLERLEESLRWIEASP